MRNHKEKRLNSPHKKQKASIETKLRRKANAEYKRKLESEVMRYESEA